MDSQRRQFGTEDIGAELLPIITTGLYSNPLDALREYIQNGIDANAKKIELKITSDLVSIHDDGHGMTPVIAERAIRLGMSEKNPGRDVGFRGIGIYSSFNICNTLEIYTRPKSGRPSKLVFNFEAIRKQLEDEESRRMNGKPSSLCLEDLLSDAVSVEEPSDFPFSGSGTQVLMVGVRGAVYRELTATDKVIHYLESVVPVPFNSAFGARSQIEEKFKQEDYRVIKLTLDIQHLHRQLFRPYTDSVFTLGQGMGPEFYDLRSGPGRPRLGFAWVCVNDARKALADKELRGLLIKKFGFSVGDRNFFSRFISRSAIHNRVTGEIIITHPDLIPNAARSEFEPSQMRDMLYMAFSNLAGKVSAWADSVQEEFKAREVLVTVSQKVLSDVKEIPESERDVSRLLALNNSLTSCESSLRSHRKVLQDIEKESYRSTMDAIEMGKKMVKEIIEATKRAKGRRRRILDAHALQSETLSEKEQAYARNLPKDLIDALKLFDIEVSDALGTVLSYIDNEILQTRLSKEDYAEVLTQLIDYLEESL